MLLLTMPRHIRWIDREPELYSCFPNHLHDKLKEIIEFWKDAPSRMEHNFTAGVIESCNLVVIATDSCREVQSTLYTHPDIARILGIQVLQPEGV